MNVPDWMKLPLAALGKDPEQFELDWEGEQIEADDERARLGNEPTLQDASYLADVLSKLFAANLLNLELQDGPGREGETMLVRGMLMRVKYVQDRRLVLELPPGRKFRKPEDGRLIVAAPRKAGA